MSGRRAVIILDSSGSMGSQVSDVVGGMEQFFVSQRESNPDLRVTLVSFNTERRTLYTDRPVSECTFPQRDYYPTGGTALLDAVGETVESIDRKRGEKILVVILTDGEENSSRRWTRNRIKALIEAKNPKNWQFLFLGVNLDSFADASASGFGVGTTRGYGTYTAAFSAVADSNATQDWYAGTVDTIVLEEGEKVLTETK